MFRFESYIVNIFVFKRLTQRFNTSSAKEKVSYYLNTGHTWTVLTLKVMCLEDRAYDSINQGLSKTI
jgi:hypothetical protein